MAGYNGPGTKINVFSSIPVPSIKFEAEGLTEKMLAQMSAPTTQPGSWDAQMRMLYGKLLYNIGIRAASLARAAILDAPLGAKISSAWKAPKEITQGVRQARRASDHALREYGTLGRSISAAISGDGLSVTIGAPDTPVQNRLGSRGSKTLTLAKLLGMFEEGYDFQVTPRSQAYFRFLAKAEMGGAEAAALKGEGGTADNLNSRALAYLRMSRLKLGTHHVAARPVLGPAFALAMDDAASTSIPKFAADFENLWVLGKKPGAGVGGMSMGVADAAV